MSGLAQHDVPLTSAVALVIIDFAIAANTSMFRVGRSVERRT